MLVLFLPRKKCSDLPPAAAMLVVTFVLTFVLTLLIAGAAWGTTTTLLLLLFVGGGGGGIGSDREKRKDPAPGVKRSSSFVQGPDQSKRVGDRKEEGSCLVQMLGFSETSPSPYSKRLSLLV